jgi:hypothetical protein
MTRPVGPTLTGQTEGQIAGPGANIQGDAAGPQTRLAGRHTPPTMVQRAGQERVQQIIARRDRVEHGAHVAGLFVGPGQRAGSTGRQVVRACGRRFRCGFWFA